MAGLKGAHCTNQDTPTGPKGGQIKGNLRDTWVAGLHPLTHTLRVDEDLGPLPPGGGPALYLLRRLHLGVSVVPTYEDAPQSLRHDSCGKRRRGGGCREIVNFQSGIWLPGSDIFVIAPTNSPKKFVYYTRPPQ